MMQPWRDWFHCTSSTYGTWLPGDPRGWRSRNHREHVDGDYNAPPPVRTYDGLHAHVKSIMMREPVQFAREMQGIALAAVVEKLCEKKIELAAAALDAHHLHVVGRFPDHRPRHWMGLAKKNATFVLRDAGLAPEGGVWAHGGLCKPVHDEGHLENSIRYVLRHFEKGAVIWSPAQGLVMPG